MTKEIEEMNKAVRSLALELPEQVYNSFHAAWERFRFRMLTPIPQPADVQERAKEYIRSKYGNPVKRGSVSSIDDVGDAYLAGVSSMQEENERLRAALEEIKDQSSEWESPTHNRITDIATEALNKQQ